MNEQIVDIEYRNLAVEKFNLFSKNRRQSFKEVSRCNNVKFNKITQVVTGRIAEINSRLLETQMKLERDFINYADQLSFVDVSRSKAKNPNVFWPIKLILFVSFFYYCAQTNDRFIVLTKYGDIWIRNVNEYLVIGIPIYNCSSDK